MKARFISLCTFILFIVCSFACTTTPVTEEEDAADLVTVPGGPAVAPHPIVGAWHGVFPCVDCPGIDYGLRLNADSTFEEQIIYQQREGEPVTRVGTWSVTRGLLELEGEDATRTRFDLSTAGELRMLDQSGNPNQNLTDAYRLKREPEYLEDDTLYREGRRNAGVDFVATGHEPGWLLEIDLEQGMFFKTRPLETVSLNTAAPTRRTVGSRTIYRSSTESGEVEVELTEQACTDAMSGRERPYTVRVTVKGVTYRGCGMYLGN
ncbi:MAG: copper resistance protein NlpE N-terminal domain-containing protein [Hymenobacteraceae bacterium]|nr:copper resistance protein NlpE N-terminal domain-containing protein [Hymenobacteraceae bacterium]